MDTIGVKLDRCAVVLEARRWIGTPFHLQAKVRGDQVQAAHRAAQALLRPLVLMPVLLPSGAVPHDLTRLLLFQKLLRCEPQLS
jgi:hypothetical protein